MNPHYKTMGLYGPEYWTYLLPKRVGPGRALELTKIDTSNISFKKEWHGYPGYFGQMIMNLLQNIERYTYPSSQGGKVDISIADYDNDNFVIIVRDYGKGISEKNLTKIFDPFFTTGRGKGGSGLGLAIVHRDNSAS